jgi:pimeloyl-ACP methyl ester carboxylesterase
VELPNTEVGLGDQLVVFVHGVLDRGRSFARVAEVLDAEYRMLLYDRRGYGDSAGRVEPVGAEVHIADLVAVLDGRRAIVVGHSFGGVIATGAASAAPELVDALVLYETSMAWAPGWDDAVMSAVLDAADPEEAALRLMLGNRYDSLSDAERARRRLDARSFVVEEVSVRRGEPPYDLAGVRAPVVFGRSDAAVMATVVDYLRQELGSLEVVTLQGAGHHAHRSTPGSFANLVRRGAELASCSRLG